MVPGLIFPFVDPPPVLIRPSSGPDGDYSGPNQSKILKMTKKDGQKNFFELGRPKNPSREPYLSSKFFSDRPRVSRVTADSPSANLDSPKILLNFNNGLSAVTLETLGRSEKFLSF